MIEGVGEGGDCACCRFRDSVAEGERVRCLVTCWEGDVLEFALVIFDLFEVKEGQSVISLLGGRRGQKLGLVYGSVGGHTCSPVSLY